MEKRKSLIAEVAAPNTKQHRSRDTNYRYDKMMETMSLTSIYPQKKKTRQPKGPTTVPQKRARTPGPAPKRKHLRKDLPLKPTEADPSGWFDGENHTPNFDGTSSPTLYSSVGKNRASTVQEHLPEWLAQTFAVLPQNHPLRCLLPVGYYDVDSSETHYSPDSTAVKTICQPTPELDQLLSAFGENDVLTSPTLVSSKVHHGSDFSDWISTCSGHLQVSRSQFTPGGSVIKSPYMRPFATPGPASTISYPPAPPQLTLNAIDISLLCSPQPPCSEDISPGLSSPAVEFGVSPNNNCYTVTKGPSSQGPLLETLPKTLLPADVDNVHFEGIAPSELYTSLDAYHRAPSLPAHFESHIEGCINSDPSSGLSSLDVDELDFQWVAFDRSGLHQDYAPKKHAYVLSNDEPDQQYPKDKPPSPDDAGRFRFQEALDSTEPELSGNSIKVFRTYYASSSELLPPLKRSSSSNRAGSRDSIESWLDLG